MGKNPRCLLVDKIESFLSKEKETTFGILCEGYHGDALTTTREAWFKEIEILKRELLLWKDSEGHIVFEYDIPRLGKRIDVVLLLRGIVFCLEFKVGEWVSGRRICSQCMILLDGRDMKFGTGASTDSSYKRENM